MENKEIKSIEYTEKTKCPTCGAEDKITAHPAPIPTPPFDKLIPVYTCQHCQTTWPCESVNSIEVKESSNPLFNRRLLASGINTITLCKDGMDANYYNVEEQFEIAKQLVNPEISSLILLSRFRLAVVKREIEPFGLVVIDVDGQEYQGYVDKSGNLVEVYLGSILNSSVFKAERMFDIEFFKLQEEAYLKKCKSGIVLQKEKESNANK